MSTLNCARLSILITINTGFWSFEPGRQGLQSEVSLPCHLHSKTNKTEHANNRFVHILLFFLPLVFIKFQIPRFRSILVPLNFPVSHLRSIHIKRKKVRCEFFLLFLMVLERYWMDLWRWNDNNRSNLFLTWVSPDFALFLFSVNSSRRGYFLRF